MRIFLLSILFLGSPIFVQAAEKPILFLPGIFGSRLYVEENGSLNKVWDGFAAEKMRKLIMDEEGNSINTIKVGTVVGRFEAGLLRVGDIYASLLNHFSCPARAVKISSPQFLASVDIGDIPGNTEGSWCEKYIVSYPYDWRYDVFDVVDKGTVYVGDEKVFLIDVVKELASKSEDGSIHILAHSNGGLVAKALLVRLEELGEEHLVDTIILVGSPQLGTPKAVGAMLHGYDQSTFAGLIKRADISRALSLNSPGAYGLLPSRKFIEENGPVAFFDTTPAVVGYVKQYGSSINSYEELIDFLLGLRVGRSQPAEGKVKEPAVLSKKILDKAEDTHRVLDAWVPPEGVRFVEVVGVGNSTPAGFSYSSKKVPTQLGTLSLLYKKLHQLKYKPVFTEYGDGEVVDSSVGKGFQERYYFHFQKLAEEEDRYRKHLDFLVDEEILFSISNIFNKKKLTSSFFLKERPNLDQQQERISISVHSPVTISVTDSQGRETSIVYDKVSNTFSIEDEIPESRVELIGESKYILVPEGEYGVEVTGLDTGSFDLVLSEIDSAGELQEINSIKQVPVKEGSTGRVEVNSLEIGNLSLDLDVDGVEDYIFSDDVSNMDTIATSLEKSLLSLPLRSKLSSAIEQYFNLWENTENESDKTNYMAQIKRIIRFLNGRYIEQDTADTWTALTEHLQ